MPDARRELDGGSWIEPTLWTGLTNADAPDPRGDLRAGRRPRAVRHRGGGVSRWPTTPTTAWRRRYGPPTCRAAHRVAQQMRVGIAWVNTWFLRDLRSPFGGVGISGIGREGGEYSLRLLHRADERLHQLSDPMRVGGVQLTDRGQRVTEPVPSDPQVTPRGRFPHVRRGRGPDLRVGDQQSASGQHHRRRRRSTSWARRPWTSGYRPAPCSRTSARILRRRRRRPRRPGPGHDVPGVDERLRRLQRGLGRVLRRVRRRPAPPWRCTSFRTRTC